MNIIVNENYKVVSLEPSEVVSIHAGILVLERNDSVHFLHGLSREEQGGDVTWVTTSIEIGLWHCHGSGATPLEAIKDMVSQLEKHFEDENKNQ